MRETREVDADVIKDLALPEPGSSKNARGIPLVVGGSQSTLGAVIFAGEPGSARGARQGFPRRPNPARGPDRVR